ncbi:MAG TPA: TolC family protein [Aquificaceae bacterium]|nr:TolC family protein [Aquificaceae bacterium]HIQ49389.1 TolC family protein [Aquifex aeolicus]
MKLFLLLLLVLVLPLFSLTLEEAIDIALKNTTDIRISELELKKLDYEVKKALSRILSSIKGSFSYSRLDDSLVFGFGIRDRQEYSITLSQTIFNKAIFESISLARKQKELQKLILEDVKREIIYRVKEMYYALLYKRLVKELKEDNLKYWEENLKIVEEKYKAGILPKVEYMRAKAQYEMAKAQLEETKADYEKSLEEFKAFLRIEGNVEPSGILNLKFPYKFPREEELMKALLKNNSTLKVARARVEIAEKAYGLAKADYYPSVDAFLSYEGFTTRRTLFGGKEWVKGYVFGISVNYKFFDGFSREANIAQKKLEILKEKEKFKDTLFTLKKDLKNALITLRSLKARIRAVKTSLQAAKESLRLSTERYKEGVANQLEVLDARTNYNNTLENLHFLLYRYFTVLALVERLTR